MQSILRHTTAFFTLLAIIMCITTLKFIKTPQQLWGITKFFTNPLCSYNLETYCLVSILTSYMKGCLSHGIFNIYIIDVLNKIMKQFCSSIDSQPMNLSTKRWYTFPLAMVHIFHKNCFKPGCVIVNTFTERSFEYIKRSFKQYNHMLRYFDHIFWFLMALDTQKFFFYM